MSTTYTDALARSREGEGLAKQIDRVNFGKREPLPLRQPKKFYFIHNVSPMRWTRGMGGMGTYIIWGIEEGERYAGEKDANKVCKVGEFIFEYKAARWGGPASGNDSQEYREHDGLQFAQDLVGVLPPTHADNDLTKTGVFISENAIPTEKEIEAARQKMLRYFQELCREADMKWAGDAMSRREVDGNAKYLIAARTLLYAADWCKLPQANIQCPACGQPVPANAAVHAGPNGCGAVINEELYLKYFPEKWAEREATKEEARKGHK